MVLFLRGWYNREMKKDERNFSWMNPKLEVKDTKKYGKGVFVDLAII